MSRSVEDVIKLHGVIRPASGHGAGILVEAGQQRHVTRPRLCGHPGVREAEHPGPGGRLLDEWGGLGLVKALTSKAIGHKEDEAPSGSREERGTEMGVINRHDRGLEVDVKNRGQEDQVKDRAGEAGREAGDRQTS